MLNEIFLQIPVEKSRMLIHYQNEYLKDKLRFRIMLRRLILRGTCHFKIQDNRAGGIVHRVQSHHPSSWGKSQDPKCQPT